MIDAMILDSGIHLTKLKVDGGAVSNNLLMQFQSDILDVPVERPMISETTALGAAYLAGLSAGFWQNKDELRANYLVDKTFVPQIGQNQRTELRDGWKRAVRATCEF
jgi:glycerol kinase